jgi:hypothetical protein
MSTDVSRGAKIEKVEARGVDGELARWGVSVVLEVVELGRGVLRRAA